MTEKIKQKRNSLEERLKKEPYPHTNIDCLILQAGISLLDDVLALLDGFMPIPVGKWQQIVKHIENRPRMVADPTTNEQNMQEWIGDLEVKVAELEETKQ